MTTITLWLLIAYGNGSTYNHGNSTPGATLIERFATVQECERVARVLMSVEDGPGKMRCVQATVAR